MQKIVILLSSLIFLFTGGVLYSDQTGNFISIDEIEVSEDVTLPAGSNVEFLGVIDVLTSVASSGRLATFQYNGNIYNADASLFEEPNEDLNFFLLSPRTYDNGGSASICTTLSFSGSGNNIDFSNIDLSRFIEVKSGNKIIDNYSILKPKDFTSSYRSNSDFCVQGLSHSTSYKVTVLPDFRAYDGFAIYAVETAISVVAKTPDMRASIQLDPSKNILPTKSDAVIPVSITNVNEFDLSIYRIDLNSLNSYNDIFSNLDQNDLRRLKSFWGENLSTKSFQIENKLNETETLNLSLNSLLKDVDPGLFVAVFESEDLNLGYWDDRPSQWFMVSNIAAQVFSGHDFTDIFINQFDTLRSVNDATIKVVAANNKTLFEEEFGSDDHIKISNKFLTGSGGFAPEIILITSQSHGTTILEVSDLKQKPKILEGGISKLTNHDVYLTTDRNIYRQEDTIHAFGSARQLDLKTIANESYSISLKNQSGNEVTRTTVETNEDGVFAADIKLKSIFPNGRYTLNVEQVDGDILAMQELSIEDFVPLTIEPKLSTDASIWKLGDQAEVRLNAEYFSGGVASGLDAELSFKIRATRAHSLEGLAGYMFGETNFNNDYKPERYEDALSADGSWLQYFENDYKIRSKNLFEILVQGTVFDVGGRPNTTRMIIPLDTDPAYLGLRPVFENRLDDGAIAQFDVVNINRSGENIPISNISYEVRRVYYDYNWYYNDGWRWRRVRVSDQVVEAGQVTGSKLNLKSGLPWGRYEITISNSENFRTNHEFFVGWGAETKPASEPEELLAYYDNNSQILKFNSPFEGQLKVMVADKDLISMEAFDVSKGPVEMSFPLGDIAEPGAHLLLTLSRAIDENTEHLPQLAVGKVWVENLSADRIIDVKFNAPTKLRSTDDVKAEFTVSQNNGSAVIFLVDDGIHSITGFKNQNIKNHYLSERELQLGFINNFGQIIQQDKSLEQLKMGGDELTETLSQIEKSDFFDTVATVSPLLEITDGKISHNFKSAEMEGRLRAVALVISEKGFGMATSEITIQDPVSIDISLPRFVAPGDSIAGKIRLRSNTFSGEIELTRRIGDFNLESTLLLSEGSSQDLLIPLQIEKTGKIPIVIEVKYPGQKIMRSFELVSRSSAYPAFELQSVRLDDNNWLGRSVTEVPSLVSNEINLNAPDTAVEVSLAPSIGINLKQAVSALNRYPYGCIEQTSSGLRGLLAYAEIHGVNSDVSSKINAGINGILRKQKNNGAFGYWDKYSSIREKYQPYAIETLQMALPFADNKDAVVEGITNGLEALYRMDLWEPSVRLYSYGILANSGYEVTTRIRYETDRLLNKIPDSWKSQKKLGIKQQELDNFAVAYWAATQINDDERLSQINAIFLKQSSMADHERFGGTKETTAWFNPSSQKNENSNMASLFAPRFGYLLSDIPEKYTTPEILQIRQKTKSSFAQKRYRSTLDNAKLVTLFKAEKEELENTTISIDGRNINLNKDRILALSKDQLLKGFKIRHNSDLPLSLNAELSGPRKNRTPIDNGYLIQKWWFDASGKHVDRQTFTANQGELFTVVIQVKKTLFNQEGDLLVTDLLPAGFEIEDAAVSSPSLSSVGIYEDSEMQPDYQANMDDRFVAHFEDEWYTNEKALLKYVVRAVYTGEVQIGGAHIEHMYAPEINGRSGSARALVIER